MSNLGSALLIIFIFIALGIMLHKLFNSFGEKVHKFFKDMFKRF